MSVRYSLGPPAAERDHDLKKYFIESELFDGVTGGRIRILIGSRGSGKSAIFRMAGERARATGTAIVEINPDEYSYEFLGKALKSEIQGAWAKQGSYAASWKFVLYVLAMREASLGAGSKTASYKKIRG